MKRKRLTPKQKVLARYPKAHATQWPVGARSWYIARTKRAWPPISGLCMEKSGAWRDAARRL